jgi:hypothetical protein
MGAHLAALHPTYDVMDLQRVKASRTPDG